MVHNFILTSTVPTANNASVNYQACILHCFYGFIRYIYLISISYRTLSSYFTSALNFSLKLYYSLKVSIDLRVAMRNHQVSRLEVEKVKNLTKIIVD